MQKFAGGEAGLRQASAVVDNLTRILKAQ